MDAKTRPNSFAVAVGSSSGSGSAIRGGRRTGGPSSSSPSSTAAPSLIPTMVPYPSSTVSNARKGTADGVTINSLCNIMGAGTLALPFAFHNASLGTSLALLLWVGLLSYHAAHALTIGCDAVGRYSYTECVVLNLMPVSAAELDEGAGTASNGDGVGSAGGGADCGDADSSSGGGDGAAAESSATAAGGPRDPLVTNKWRRLLTIGIESIIVLSGFGTLVVYSRVIGDAVPTVFASVGLGGMFEASAASDAAASVNTQPYDSNALAKALSPTRAPPPAQDAGAGGVDSLFYLAALAPSASGLADLVFSWLIPAGIFFLLSCAQTMEKLKWASILGFGTIFYIVVLVILYYFKEAVFVHHGVAVGDHIRWAGLDWGVFGAVSTFAIAYRYHFNVPYFYGELKVRRPAAMMATTDRSMILVVVCYVLTGLCGYLLFGSLVEGDDVGGHPAGTSSPSTAAAPKAPGHGHAGGNIIDNFSSSDFLANVGRFGLLIHFAMSYPIISVCTRRGMHRLYVLWAQQRQATAATSQSAATSSGGAGAGRNSGVRGGEERGQEMASLAAAKAEASGGAAPSSSLSSAPSLPTGNRNGSGGGGSGDSPRQEALTLAHRQQSADSAAVAAAAAASAPSQKAVMVEAAILVFVTSAIAHSIHGIGAVMELFGALFGVPTVMILPGLVGLRVFHLSNADKWWLAHLAASSDAANSPPHLAFALFPTIAIPYAVASRLPAAVRSSGLFVGPAAASAGAYSPVPTRAPPSHQMASSSEEGTAVVSVGGTSGDEDCGSGAPQPSPAQLEEVRRRLVGLRSLSWALVVFGLISFVMGLITSQMGHH